VCLISGLTRTFITGHSSTSYYRWYFGHGFRGGRNNRYHYQACQICADNYTAKSCVFPIILYPGIWRLIYVSFSPILTDVICTGA